MKHVLTIISQWRGLPSQKEMKKNQQLSITLPCQTIIYGKKLSCVMYNWSAEFRPTTIGWNSSVISVICIPHLKCNQMKFWVKIATSTQNDSPKLISRLTVSSFRRQLPHSSHYFSIPKPSTNPVHMWTYADTCNFNYLKHASPYIKNDTNLTTSIVLRPLDNLATGEAISIL